MSDSMEYLEDVIGKINRDQTIENLDNKRSINKIANYIKSVVDEPNDDEVLAVLKSLRGGPRVGDEDEKQAILFDKNELRVILFALLRLNDYYGY